MKVKLLVPICGPEGSFLPGDEPDLSEKLAKALIADRHAISLDVIAAVNIIADKMSEFKPEIKPVSIPPQKPPQKKKK